MSIANLLERAEQCHQEVALEYYNALSGRQDKLDIVSILNNYPELYSKETLALVRETEGQADLDERERRFLKLVFTSNYFTGRLKSYTDKLANAEGDSFVEFDGQRIPYRAAPVVLANEADYDKRGGLGRAYLAKLAELNPLREEAEGISRDLVDELGYTSVIDMMQQLALMRIYPMRDLLAGFLDATDGIYEERLERYSAETPGLSRETLRYADIGFLMRAGRFDHLFPPKEMVPALARTLKGLGIDLDSQPNVTLDLEERPKKSPRAFCIGIDVPRDVRLVLQPRGGQDDFATLFHEAGHLQFGAHMSPGLPFMYRQYGDTSVHESYAFLLQHLVDDPAWWHEIMGTEPPAEFIRFARFHRLYFLRRYGSKLLYEVEYHERGGGRALADVYAERLQRGCGVAYPKERYLEDFDFGFYVLQYLQAWIWERQLRGHLKREFGDAWFTNQKAGDFLRELWHDGQKYDVWEIAERLGFSGLDIEPIKAELTE
ncbi:hypothetical protein JW859_11735 [bacterium]|nr:hypothetical protein [bacterium]